MTTGQFRRYANASNREVCERLNISESNLWVMSHRARKQLRSELDEWWRAEPAAK